MAGITNYKKEFDKRLGKFQLKPDEWIGSIGDVNGNVYPFASNTSIIYVRNIVSGGVHEVLNQRVPVRLGLLVKVGHEVTTLGREQILSTWDVYESMPVLQVPEHSHDTSGDNTDFVREERILPWLVLPNPDDSFSIDIYPGVDRVGDTVIFSLLTTVDLSSHVPTDGALFVTVCLADDGTFSIVDGTTVDTPEVLTGADVPLETVGTIPKAWVRLFTGQEKIRREPEYTDIWTPLFANGVGGLPAQTPYRILIVDSTGRITTDANFKIRNSGAKSPIFGAWEPAQDGDGLVHAVGDGTSVAGRFIAWYLGTANQPGHTGIRGEGTPANPAYVHADKILEVIRGAGFGVTDSPNPGDVGYALPADAGSSSLWSKFEMRIIADEDWDTVTKRGTRLELWGVPNGAVDKQLIATFRAAGIDLPAGENFSVNGVSVGGGFMSRVLSADLTIPDTDYLVMVDYIEAGTYDIHLQGDAALMIL